MTESSTRDLVIVGGGMVGASLALSLSGTGMRISLIEAAVPATDSQAAFDDRAIALAYGTRRIFDTLGLWDGIAADAEPIARIHVSDRGQFGFTHLSAAEENVPALGYVITARALGRHLWSALAQCDDVEVLAPCRLQGFTITDAVVSLDLDCEGQSRNLQASLLVAADGNRSAIREQLGVPVRRWDYGQSAVVTNVATTKPHNGVAFERFTRAGPMALLPMAGKRSAMVWTVDNDELDQVLSLDDAAFLRAAQERFGYRLGRFTRVGKRQSYPLGLIRALESTRPRVAIIGNAAHTLHPIAGQGFNLGIRDVAALAEVLLDAQREGLDPGADAVLARYAEWREGDQRLVSLATDGLARLFSNPLPLFSVGRNLGMLALDLVPGLKHGLARAAMGLHGRLPALTRGVRRGRV